VGSGSTRPCGGDNRFLHVIWIDGAAGSVTPAGADGVTLQLGTASVTVQFNRDRIGGTLTIGGKSTALVTGVDSVPE
jgi:hypothetical protein